MSITLDEAIALVTLEADLLDHGQFMEWLGLYTADGRYVVPIDPDVDDFESVLNYAYDDAEMRRKRVERLLGGRSISAAPPARTVRLQARYRMLESDDTHCTFRCAQHLTELRQGRERDYAANVTYRLVRTPDGLKIDLKVIRLLGSTEALTAVSYIL
ncbi:aromatic-ring-hydroxylating dioxygenase subunit beta [Nguyenibacter sp. L1]|uniref:aromatic-ring-hydroxylating dioxygenase subunit beta n=1 Tax=Nguyenibacter sp. L1 TaxID=3049350 RepID=UPI002B47E48E|nr:aromatic-ring-hydroxylating dioxygenase subunit beta [Nguyenibacter sp. L1]WRH89301.1 aromatic-ring-hydroxylating dioxygenase subunit beta [Nguyenibacter sp. L1]